MNVSIIIPSYRRYWPLINTIQDLQKQDYQDFEIIVIDQNPSWPNECHADLDRIREDSRLTWVTQENPGVVVARNTAVQRAKGEILIFIDDDVKISDPGFISKHLKNYEDPSIHIVVGRECNPDFTPEGETTNNLTVEDSVHTDHLRKLSPLQQALWFDRNSEYRTRVCTFSTCNGSIRKSTLLAVHGFDENFQGNSYGDDYDLILRLNQLGYQGIYDPTVWLIHLRVPMGGLRMSDVKNRVNYLETATGFWLFLLRHGTYGMYWHLIYYHILRKTILLKVNLEHPYRQLFVIPEVVVAFFRACLLLKKGTQSRLKIAN